MQINVLVIFLLVAICALLLIIFFKIKNSSNTSQEFEIKKINENLNNLINRTI